MTPATTYEAVFQRKMHTAEHWRILADDTALAINNNLILKGYIESDDFVKPRYGGVEECIREATPIFTVLRSC